MFIFYRFLVPMNMMVGEFKYIVHKHINQCAMARQDQDHGVGPGAVTHEKTIYLFVNNTAPKAGALMQEVRYIYIRIICYGFYYQTWVLFLILSISSCMRNTLVKTVSFISNILPKTLLVLCSTQRSSDASNVFRPISHPHSSIN